MALRVAIDIGGTFTDATLFDEATGKVSIAKVSTTPSDPSEGFMQALERALAEGGHEAARVGFVFHATTVATNAIIEGKIARSGFVTTEGFRDLLEIARQVRPTLYDTPVRGSRGRSCRATARSVCASVSVPRERSCSRSTRARCARRRRCSRASTSSRSPSACSTPTSIPSTSGGSGRSSPRSSQACRCRSRRRSRPSSASTYGRAPR